MFKGVLSLALVLGHSFWKRRRNVNQWLLKETFLVLCNTSSRVCTCCVNLVYIGKEILVYIYKGKRLQCASDNDVSEKPAVDGGAPGFLCERPRATQCLVVALYL